MTSFCDDYVRNRNFFVCDGTVRGISTFFFYKFGSNLNVIIFFVVSACAFKLSFCSAFAIILDT